MCCEEIWCWQTFPIKRPKRDKRVCERETFSCFFLLLLLQTAKNHWRESCFNSDEPLFNAKLLCNILILLIFSSSSWCVCVCGCGALLLLLGCSHFRPSCLNVEKTLSLTVSCVCVCVWPRIVFFFFFMQLLRTSSLLRTRTRLFPGEGASDLSVCLSFKRGRLRKYCSSRS